MKEAGHGHFHKGFFLYYKLRNVMRNSDRKRGKYQIKITAFFSEYIYGHNLPPEWFYSIDKMAIFINAFQLFLLASGSVL